MRSAMVLFAKKIETSTFLHVLSRHRCGWRSTLNLPPNPQSRLRPFYTQCAKGEEVKASIQTTTRRPRQGGTGADYGDRRDARNCLVSTCKRVRGRRYRLPPERIIASCKGQPNERIWLIVGTDVHYLVSAYTSTTNVVTVDTDR